MSKVKDRKLKKLKKQRIWPYILGIFVIVVVFFVLAVIIMSFMVVNIVYDNLRQAYDSSTKLTTIVSTMWEEGDTEGIDAFYEDVSTAFPYVGEICIVDSDKNVLYSTGNEVPNWDNAIENVDIKAVNLYLSDDKDNFIYYDGEVVANTKQFLTVLKKMKTEHYFNDELLSAGYVLSSEMWVEVGKDDYSVCYKNTMGITETEFSVTITVITVIFGLEVVLLAYYLFSLISLIFERRKVARIIETDIVTGGNNLTHFYKNGKRILKKKKETYCVVNIRLEKYRNFCSCYGLQEGVELLEHIYNTLAGILNKNELIAHGEKSDFALLLTYNNEDEFKERLVHVTGHLGQVRDNQKLIFSVGICKVDDADVEIDSLYNYAGVAIGTLLPDTENRVVFFTDDMRKEQIWHRKVENDIDRAIADKEFQVYLQPKYSTKEEQLSGAEALVRWIHPTEGFVAPFRFIPILESTGLIIKLDDYMISEVARLQSEWLSQGKEIVPISVNISRVHFARQDLAEHICSLVDEYAVPHEFIELELTESAFFDDKDVLLNIITKLKSYGFEISMDDFGAGYSSLNSLKELPLDVLKLDAGFFREEDKDGRGKVIIGDTIALAKKLDMRIVAEGIETREQVDLLASMDCDLIQGYYFAKPMPVSDFEERAFSEKKTEE